MDTTNFTAVLKELGACDESIEWVDSRPLSAVWGICPNNDWKEWLLRAVNHPALKVYRDAVANARKVYQDAKANALKAYDDDAEANALKVYQDAEASTWKAYLDAVAPALKAYRDAVAPALKAVDVQSVQDAIDRHFGKV